MSKRHIDEDEYDNKLKKELLSEVKFLDALDYHKISVELQFQDACVDGSIEKIKDMLNMWLPGGVKLFFVSK